MSIRSEKVKKTQRKKKLDAIERFGEIIMKNQKENSETIPCYHQEHNPPMSLYIPEGKIYKHVCPNCHKEIIIKSTVFR